MRGFRAEISRSYKVAVGNAIYFFSGATKAFVIGLRINKCSFTPLQADVFVGLAVIEKWPCRDDKPQLYEERSFMTICVHRKQLVSLFDSIATHWRWPMLFVIACFCLAEAVTGHTQQPRGTISPQQFSEFGSSVEFDINLVRLYPNILDNPQFMRYFVALNNCGSPQIPQLLNNELDFPQIAAYYKAHAAEIISGLPPIVSVGLYGGARSHGDDRLLDTAKLGEYDVQRGVFPIITHQGMSVMRPGGDSSSAQSPSTGSGNLTISLGGLFGRKSKSASTDGGKSNANEHHVVQMNGDFGIESVRDTLMPGCPAANAVVHLAGRQFGFLPHDYSVRTEAAGFDEVPMPESAAREYINKHPPTSRGVMFVVYIRLLDQPPQVDQMQGRSDQSLSQAAFAGKIAKVDVVDVQSGGVIASLLDDHSVPSFMDAQEQPQASEGPESTVFMAHLPQMPPGAVKFQYTSTKRMATLQQSIDTVVAIAMEHDFCKWPIGSQAQHNVVDFLNDIQSDSAHSARIPIAAQTTQKRMDILGPQYCGNFQEKYRYELMMNQIWPNGKLANPDAF